MSCNGGPHSEQQLDTEKILHILLPRTMPGIILQLQNRHSLIFPHMNSFHRALLVVLAVALLLRCARASAGDQRAPAGGFASRHPAQHRTQVRRRGRGERGGRAREAQGGRAASRTAGGACAAAALAYTPSPPAQSLEAY